MTIHLGNVDAGSTLYIPFDTYSSAGASITLTGLAVTDIEIYKNGSVTQRASDAGYVLLDTDGIDFDGITGIHGFSIDLNDNTDAGFFAAGSFYWVVVSAVTIDSQTVNFVAATFKIGPVSANVTQNAGTAITAAAGIQEVKVASLANDSITAAVIANGAIDAATFAAGAITATVIADGAIDAGAIAADAITAAKIADGAIDAATFAAGAIDAAAIAANAIGASELAADAAAEIADAILDRDMSTGTDSGSTTVRTPRQALRFLRNKWSISGTTLTVTKEDDTTASWTSSLTATAGANPITASDPAS
jgi:hypothetical protein